MFVTQYCLYSSKGDVITIGMDLYRPSRSMTQGRTAPIVSALMTNKGYVGPILIKQLQVTKYKILAHLRLIKA